jgi:hypothetical protein
MKFILVNIDLVSSNDCSLIFFCLTSHLKDYISCKKERNREREKERKREREKERKREREKERKRERVKERKSEREREIV